MYLRICFCLYIRKTISRIPDLKSRTLFACKSPLPCKFLTTFLIFSYTPLTLFVAISTGQICIRGRSCFVQEKPSAVENLLSPFPLSIHCHLCTHRTNFWSWFGNHLCLVQITVHPPTLPGIQVTQLQYSANLKKAILSLKIHI